ncbi:hypothetical protein ACOP1M_00105 [Staphylococcus warneri]|uniref:hypothetical protein n=1 Tax=Staphylococcus warneri TaxID=1292 RepID=UPI003CFB15C2
MKISEVLYSLRLSYDDVKNSKYQENQKLFVEMGWAVRRLIERREITYFDNFNDAHIQSKVFNEMTF